MTFDERLRAPSSNAFIVHLKRAPSSTQKLGILLLVTMVVTSQLKTADDTTHGAWLTPDNRTSSVNLGCKTMTTNTDIANVVIGTGISGAIGDTEIGHPRDIWVF